METSEQIVELVRSAKKGNDIAFEELIKIFSRQLLSVALGLLANKEDAEEVVQDTFIKAYQNINSLREDQLFASWIYRITVNLCRNRYKYNRVRGGGCNISIQDAITKDADTEQKEDIQLPSQSPTPDVELSNSELEKKILEEIRKLPDTYREAIVLRHVNNMSYAEIADTLNCSLEAVKTKISRGRAILAKRIEGKI